MQTKRRCLTKLAAAGLAASEKFTKCLSYMANLTESLLMRLLNETKAQNLAILQELEFVRQNTRGLITGSVKDAGWSIIQFIGQNLPGRPNNVLGPGESVTLISDDELTGRLATLEIWSSNPYLTGTVELKTETNTWNTVILSPYLGNALGSTQSNALIPWVSRYDTLNSIFVVQWAPLEPLGYHNGIHVTLTNPAQTPLGTANTSPAVIPYLSLIRVVFRGQHVSPETQKLLGEA
jgi:hypothetical protein